MSKGLVERSSLEDIGDALREKYNNTATYTPAQMGDAIRGITAGDNIDHKDLPTYVKAGALEVAKRVKAHIQNDSIVFLAGSDSHQSTTEHVEDGNLHGGMAMKALAYMLPLDFVAFLGDYTAGSNTTTLEEGRGHFTSINADIDEAFRGIPQFRTTGNHDPLGYSYAANNNQSLGLAEMYQYIGKYNDDGTTVMGSTTSGYCYRDFSTKKVRVICLNTAEADGNGNQPPQGSAEFMTTAQKCWFADTLISTPQDYGIILLAHHPLDWGKIIIQASHIVRAYAEELAPSQQNTINFGSGVTYDFTGKRKAAWILDFHGHVHTFTVDNLHYVTNIVNSTTATAYNVKRIAVPNMCFVRNNEYGRNTGYEYYDIEFGTTQTWNKTANSGEDTAFSAFVVNPSEEKVYVINYGAGYDREVYWGETIIPVTGVTLDENSGTLTVGDTKSLTATVSPANATNKNVTWTSSNTAVATVSNGVITAVAIGNATITVTTNDGGYTASYGVTVEAVKIEPTNLVPLSTTTDGSTIFNDTGYMDDKYASGSNVGNATGYVATGMIHIPNPDQVSYIYIRGADIDDTSYSRWIVFNENGYSQSWGQKGSDTNGFVGYWVSAVEKLGTEYYRLTMSTTFATQYMISAERAIRFSLKGSGEHLFISFNDPIIDEYYPWSTMVTYTVTNNLTNISSTNAMSQVNEGTSYTATLSTTQSGYTVGTVTVTMGGSDITSTAYDQNSKTITIASVTGNIIITATAEETGLNGNLMPTVGWFDDTRRRTNGETATDAGIVSTGYIDIHTGVSYPATVRIKGAEFRTAKAWQANLIAYPSTKLNGVASNIVDGGSGPNVFANSTMTVSSDGQQVVLTLPTKNNTYPYIIFNAKGSGSNLDLRINEEFD